MRRVVSSCRVPGRFLLLHRVGRHELQRSVVKRRSATDEGARKAVGAYYGAASILNVTLDGGAGGAAASAFARGLSMEATAVPMGSTTGVRCFSGDDVGGFRTTTAVGSPFAFTDDSMVIWLWDACCCST